MPPLTSVGVAWTLIQASAAKMEEMITAKDMKGVHAKEGLLSGAVKYLEMNSPMVAGDQRKRLDAAIKQALGISANLHQAADNGQPDKAAAEFKKLEAALLLVAAQYPPEVLKASAAEYVCPMHPEVKASKPGKCPKCGMDLEPNLRSTGHAAHNDEHAAEQSSIQLVASTAQPLNANQPADVTLLLQKSDGSPLLPDDLQIAHTMNMHVLIIDPSLADYHHEHPEPGDKAGEYRFTFTPRKTGPYRLWVDLVPKATGRQEYLLADLPGTGPTEKISDRTAQLTAVVDGLTYTVEFAEPLKAGKTSTGTLTVRDSTGAVFSKLEPIMGAYAHLVGFSEDFKTIAHIHPMGAEPTKLTDRGAGELKFHISPEKAGLLRLFAQVQIGGQSKFARFTLNVAR
ncbi:MAG: heavy metal-binding domain-containing protein [Chthoniobacterales bacterium]